MAIPADPKRPYKAYIATAVSALSIFVAAWVADEGTFTAKEIAAAVVAALVGAGLTGAGTFAVRNPAVAEGAVGKHDTGWKNERGEVNGIIGLLVTVILVILLVWLVLALVR